MIDELKALFPRNKALFCTKEVIEEVDCLLEAFNESEGFDPKNRNRALELIASIILAEKAE